jgi:hypothetical protein
LTRSLFKKERVGANRMHVNGEISQEANARGNALDTQKATDAWRIRWAYG